MNTLVQKALNEEEEDELASDLNIRPNVAAFSQTLSITYFDMVGFRLGCSSASSSTAASSCSSGAWLRDPVLGFCRFAMG